MEAKELRIGNYVIGISNTPEVIELISKDEVDTDIHDSLKITLADPIPLTEEWLLKFGFKKASHYYFNDDYYFSLIDYENKINYVLDDDRGDYMELKHIHQLQNLYFALTGEELTTKMC